MSQSDAPYTATLMCTYMYMYKMSLMSCDCHMQAEEEFNIEKGRLLQNEKRKVATYFERREKQLELQRKM